jgi:hypothetical protein
MTEEYTVHPAAYAKGKLLVRCPSSDGFKTRAARLIGDGLKGRWTNRESGYLASPARVEKFKRLYAEGWDGSFITGELLPPAANEEEDDA